MRLRLAVLAFPAPALAGVPTTTIVTHGFSTDSKGAWVQGFAEAALARAGGVGSVYRYTGATGVWTAVPEAGGDGSTTNLVLIFNWVPESDAPASGPNWNYVQAAGDALHAMLRDPAWAPGPGAPSELLLGRAVHFVGHSRGAIVVSEAIRRLALDGIVVDQMTTLDPHPVNGTLDAPYNPNWGDPLPVRWSNVAWADNYWRADGGGLINGLDFDGIPLPDVHDTMLDEAALNCCANFFAHSDVHLWYHGTVDLAPNPSDGEQVITDLMRATWWPEGHEQRGYFYSVVGGGAARRPAIPGGVDPAPDSAPRLYNGGFAQGSRAGWAAHGGSGTNVVSIGGGNWVFRLGASSPLLVHNRAYLPDAPLTISLRLRRNGSGPSDDVVRVAYQRHEDPAPVAVPAAAWPVEALSSAFVEVVAPLPAGLRGRTVRISIALDGGGDGIDASVDLDDIAVVELGAEPGDLDGDGVVDGADLGLLLGSWGACPGCPADLDGNGLVDGADLGLLLGAWTA